MTEREREHIGPVTSHCPVMSSPIPLPEAARLLGLTVEALRKRCQRRQIEAFRDNTGRWMVNLDPSTLSTPAAENGVENASPMTQDKLVGALLDLLECERTERGRLLDLIEGLAHRMEEAGRAMAMLDRLTIERDQAVNQLTELKSMVSQLVSKLDSTSAGEIRREIVDLKTSTGRMLLDVQRTLREGMKGE